MGVKSFVFAGFLGAVGVAWGQAPAEEGDPFRLPPEAQAFVRQATKYQATTPLKLKALLEAIFRSKADGGMGLVYDNSRTRSVEDVWKEGKANCLSITAFYVMAVRSLGIRDQYAEALNTMPLAQGGFHHPLREARGGRDPGASPQRPRGRFRA